MRLQIYLKTQNELRDEIAAYLDDDVQGSLAVSNSYYRALNQAIQLWGGRVVVPHLYEFSFAAGTFEYALPGYIRRPFHLQIRTTIMGLHGLVLDSDEAYTYQEFVAYDVEPDGLGGMKLRVHSFPYAETGRIIWYQENGPVPLLLPMLSSALGASDTSAALTVPANCHVNNTGWVRIDGEWLSYSGLTRVSATSYTLNNLIRGLNSTTASAHDSGAEVEWGVATDDMRLWQQLYDRAGSFIHFGLLHKSTTEDMGRHERLYIAMKNNADNFWKQEGYVSQRGPRLVPKRGSLGAMPWN